MHAAYQLPETLLGGRAGRVLTSRAMRSPPAAAILAVLVAAAGCGGAGPPPRSEQVRIAPGVPVPAVRTRTVRVRLENRPGCTVTGKTWAEATNAQGLEAFSTPLHFRLGAGALSRAARRAILGACRGRR